MASKAVSREELIAIAAWMVVAHVAYVVSKNVLLSAEFWLANPLEAVFAFALALLSPSASTLVPGAIAGAAMAFYSTRLPAKSVPAKLALGSLLFAVLAVLLSLALLYAASPAAMTAYVKYVVLGGDRMDLLLATIENGPGLMAGVIMIDTAIGVLHHSFLLEAAAGVLMAVALIAGHRRFPWFLPAEKGKK